jgi:hypothetical protein
VLPERISTDPEKLKAGQICPTLKNKHGTRSFLSLYTYYRQFIFSFADIAKPLRKFTEHKRSFQWTSEAQVAFEKLKVGLCPATILVYPKPGEGFIFDTDASNCEIGGVLSQVQDGQEHVIAYYSKRLNKAERNYCVTRRELLAIVRTVEHFHKYLYGQTFHLRTDHSALTWLMGFRTWKGKPHVGSSAYRSTISLRSIVKAGNTTMPTPFHEDPVRRIVVIAM